MEDAKKIRAALKDCTRDELVAIIEALLPLIDRVQELEREVERLKNQNSRNSSLPPSRDNQGVKKKTRTLRKKSSRKKGGQKGHDGRTLELSKKVDHVIDYQPDQCDHCQERIASEGILIERKQVWDIPPISLEVTEHRRYKKYCAQCGKWSCSAYGADMQSGPPVRYGDRLQNQIVYLSTRQLLPYKRLCEAMEVIYGQKISEGTIDNIIRSKSKQAVETYSQVIHQIEKSDVVGVDESGCSVKGSKSWAWIWVTSKYSLLHISDNRGHLTTKALFPKGFTRSILNSDCWRTHLKTKAKAHQICIPHLRRECQGLMEFHKSKWAGKLDNILLEILLVCRMPRIPKLKKIEIEDKLTRVLAYKLTQSHKSIQSLKARLERLRDCLTVCLYNRKVPPDNNASERAIRMIKLKAKISGTFRSNEGAHRFSVLRTIVDSAIKQGIHPFEALQNPNIIINSS
jgi:transposase